MFGRKSTYKGKGPIVNAQAATAIEQEQIPMPPKKELERLYLQLLEELAIPEAKRDVMVKTEDDERKWKLVCLDVFFGFLLFL